jgi:maltose O-acetyltransferase
MVELLGGEVAGVATRARLSALVGLVLPDGSAHRLRTAALRACGWKIGSGSILASVPRLSGQGPLVDRLSIGEGVYVNVGGHWDLNERIEIGDRVSIGHEVLLLTSSHQLGDHHRRAAALDHRPITIGHGVWIGARSVVLPGVCVGDGAVVGAGTVVRHDVPPSCLYAGEPGRVIRVLDQP